MTQTTQDILTEMRKRNPPQSVEAMILAGETVTQKKMDAIQKIQESHYINREQMPETYLHYADLYHELTGQEPTKRVFSDWMLTFEEWKQERLLDEHIRAAFGKANEPNGFPVGRPGALTVTAVAMKTKLTKTAQPAINTEAIAYTKRLVEEKYGGEVKFVPRPENVARPKGLLAKRNNL